MIYMKSLILLLGTSLVLSSCTSTKLQVSTKPVELKVAKLPAPRSVDPMKVNFVVINAKNIDNYLELIKNGDIVIYGLSPSEFSRLLKNQNELKRYIEQQKSIIAYYENVSGAE